MTLKHGCQVKMHTGRSDHVQIAQIIKLAGSASDSEIRQMRKPD